MTRRHKNQTDEYELYADELEAQRRKHRWSQLMLHGSNVPCTSLPTDTTHGSRTDTNVKGGFA